MIERGNSESQVIVWQEKDYDLIYDASTPEIFAASSLSILSEMNDRYYRDPAVLDSHDELCVKRWEDLCSLSEADIAALPGNLRESMAKEQKQAMIEIARWQLRQNQEVVWYEQVQQVLRERDMGFVNYSNKQIPIAWRLLLMRNDCEYENVHLECVHIGVIDDDRFETGAEELCEEEKEILAQAISDYIETVEDNCEDEEKDRLVSIINSIDRKIRL